MTPSARLHLLGSSARLSPIAPASAKREVSTPLGQLQIPDQCRICRRLHRLMKQPANTGNHFYSRPLTCRSSLPMNPIPNNHSTSAVAPRKITANGRLCCFPFAVLFACIFAGCSLPNLQDKIAPYIQFHRNDPGLRTLSEADAIRVLEMKLMTSNSMGSAMNFGNDWVLKIHNEGIDVFETGTKNVTVSFASVVRIGRRENTVFLTDAANSDLIQIRFDPSSHRKGGYTAHGWAFSHDKEGTNELMSALITLCPNVK